MGAAWSGASHPDEVRVSPQNGLSFLRRTKHLSSSRGKDNTGQFLRKYSVMSGQQPIFPAARNKCLISKLGDEGVRDEGGGSSKWHVTWPLHLLNHKISLIGTYISQVLWVRFNWIYNNRSIPRLRNSIGRWVKKGRATQKKVVVLIYDVKGG